MKKPTVILGVLASIVGSAAAADGGECLAHGYFSDGQRVTSISLSYSFADAQLNAPWLLSSLTTSLRHGPVGAQRVERPAKAIAADGKLLLGFCIRGTFSAGESFELIVGPRAHTLLARSAGTSQVTRAALEAAGATMSPDLKAITLHVMPHIAVLPQAAPDWLILTRSDAQRTSDGHLRVEVQIFSPTTTDQQGIAVAFEFVGESTIACMAPVPRPRAQQIAVSIELGKGAAKAFTTEPTFGTELVQRKANLFPESCGNAPAFELFAGHTGTLFQGFNTIRYAFKQGRLLVPRSVPLYANGDWGERDILRWGTVRVLMQGHIYPTAALLQLP